MFIIVDTIIDILNSKIQRYLMFVLFIAGIGHVKKTLPHVITLLVRFMTLFFNLANTTITIISYNAVSLRKKKHISFFKISIYIYFIRVTQSKTIPNQDIDMTT